MSAAALRHALGIPLPSYEQVIHERLTIARKQLDEHEWVLAWAEGQAMMLEQMVAFASARV